ncbi:MAG: hypothetical protein HOI47_09020 [Candidatus Scalindua sp.]|nr:hypothetical protein [Candidatus Scalindua sp.]
MKTNTILLAVIITAIISATVSTGCNRNSHDKNFIPYGLIGLNVYVYNNKTDKEFFVGEVTGKYRSRKNMLRDAQSMASAFALDYKLKDWSYVCCTATSTSGCVTKVR